MGSTPRVRDVLQAPVALDASGRQRYVYRAATHPLPPYWHLYVVQEAANGRRFVQSCAADLSGPTALLLPAAESDLLHDPASGGKHPVHQIEPTAIQFEGVRLERRTILARRTDATPVLWTQRRRLLLLTRPGSARQPSAVALLLQKTSSVQADPEAVPDLAGSMAFNVRFNVLVDYLVQILAIDDTQVDGVREMIQALGQGNAQRHEAFLEGFIAAQAQCLNPA